MRRKNLDNMFNLIDDDILEETNPTKPKRSGISKFGWVQIVAVAACLILTLNMAIIVPVILSRGDDTPDESKPTDVIQNDSDTQNVIQKPEGDVSTESDTAADKESDTSMPSDTENGGEENDSTSTETDINDKDTSTDEPAQNPPSDKPSDTPSDTENDTSSQTPGNPPIDTNKDTSTSTDIEGGDEPPLDSDTSDDKDTETDTDTDGGDEEDTDTNIKIDRIQSITNIHINIPNRDSHTISLRAPLTGASSEYQEIITSMQSIAGGSLGGNIVDKNEEIKDTVDDLFDKVEEEIKDSSKEDQDYKETTDNQVGGIIEGDIIKRSSEYIYYLSGSTLKIYPINEADTALLAQFSLKDYIEAIRTSLEIQFEMPEKEQNEEKVEDILDRNSLSYVKEMFLSEDCKTITVIVEHHIYSVYVNDALNDKEFVDRYIGDDIIYYTSLISLNVEDPNIVYPKEITTVFGTYEEARLVDGSFLLFTKYTPLVEELIIPQYSTKEGFKRIDVDKIYSPEVYSNQVYLLSFIIDGTSYDVLDASAYASFDGEIYVTNDNIYVTRQHKVEKREEEKYPIYSEENGSADREIIGFGTKTIIEERTVTEILRIDYSSGRFAVSGSVEVDGYIKDRYSIHENGEYLYIVTTVGGSGISKIEIDDGGKEESIEKDFFWDTATSASLFVVNLGNMKEISSVEHFAPKGETVRSVRYDGSFAYVCTAVEIVDPVFFFDITNPLAIVYSNTGTIPGFSTQLIELPNGELLGIGTDGNAHVKIEVYRLGENNTVEIVDTYLVNASTYSTDYKSHYINRGLGLFGLGIKDNLQSDKERYVMVQYKDGEISLVFNVALTGTNSSKRAVYDEETGYFYLFSSNDFMCFTPKQ